MPTERTRIDRRTFLALGAGALAWACTRGKGTSGANAISIIPTGQEGLAVGDTRNAFAVLRGQKPIVPKSMAVRMVPPNGGAPFAIEVAKQRITLGQGGTTQGAEVVYIWSFRHDFDPGIWTIQAIVDGQGAEGAFQIFPAADPSPNVGEHAIASQSPTTSDPRGVDPICTRTPPCSMHDKTIADALASNKPLLIAFATPEFCTSRTCGPVVDLVEASKQRVGDAASFVHVEIYKNLADVAKKGGSPTYNEWKLGSEPWLFFIDAAGVVKDRWLGAVGTDELRREVDGLVAGKL